MKEMILILIVLAIFVFGYFVMAKMDRFLTRIRRPIIVKNRISLAPAGRSRSLRIGAENRQMAQAVASAAERCRAADPGFSLHTDVEKDAQLLKKLAAGRYDAILLDEARSPLPEGIYESAAIPFDTGDRECWMLAVWNKDAKAEGLTRLISVLEDWGGS